VLKGGYTPPFIGSLIKEGMAIAGETEQGVFEALGLPYPLPFQREIVDSKPVWLPPQK